MQKVDMFRGKRPWVNKKKQEKLLVFVKVQNDPGQAEHWCKVILGVVTTPDFKMYGITRYIFTFQESLFNLFVAITKAEK